MTKNTTAGLGIFAKYLTLWVIICMIAGTSIAPSGKKTDVAGVKS